MNSSSSVDNSLYLTLRFSLAERLFLGAIASILCARKTRMNALHKNVAANTRISRKQWETASKNTEQTFSIVHDAAPGAKQVVSECLGQTPKISSHACTTQTQKTFFPTSLSCFCSRCDLGGNGKYFSTSAFRTARGALTNLRTENDYL